jgi:hypothetical protein
MSRNEGVTDHPIFARALEQYQIRLPPSLRRLTISTGPEVTPEARQQIRHFIRGMATPLAAQTVCDLIVSFSRWEDAFHDVVERECAFHFRKASETGNLDPQALDKDWQDLGGNPFVRPRSSADE